MAKDFNTFLYFIFTPYYIYAHTCIFYITYIIMQFCKESGKIYYRFKNNLFFLWWFKIIFVPLHMKSIKALRIMKNKKFTIDGREYEGYQLSNEQIVRLIKDDTNICSDDRDYLLNKVLERFEYNLCKRNGETNEDVFARLFGDYINGKLGNKKKVAKLMSCEHRYLQNEMFHVCLEYIKKLAENCEKGYYDGRNKYAAETSKKIIDYFKEIDYPF